MMPEAFAAAAAAMSAAKWLVPSAFTRTKSNMDPRSSSPGTASMIA